MNDAVLAALLGVVGGVVLTVLLLLTRRLAKGTTELGSDAEQATYRTLHQASLAATHLRGGLDSPDVERATRHLRALLGSTAVALVGADGVVAYDGPAADADRKSVV